MPVRDWESEKRMRRYRAVARQRQLFEPGNEANNERGERGDNVGEQLLLSQPPPRRLLLLFVPDRTGLALFDLPDAQTFELTAPSAPLSPSCYSASHLLGLPVPQKLFSGQLAAVGRTNAQTRGIAQRRAPIPSPHVAGAPNAFARRARQSADGAGDVRNTSRRDLCARPRHTRGAACPQRNSFAAAGRTQRHSARR